MTQKHMGNRDGWRASWKDEVGEANEEGREKEIGDHGQDETVRQAV